MLKIKKMSEVLGKQVYTSDGDYFGQVEEVNLQDNKIDGWKIRVGQGFISMLGGARGVIVPHQFVKSIGDVFVINSAALRVPAGSSEVPAPSDAASGVSGEGIDLA